MRRIIHKLHNKFVNYANDFDYDTYWKRHDKLFDANVPKVFKLYYLYWLRRIDIKHGAYIHRILGGKNNFANWPTLGHGLNGIVIAAGASIGRNCYISHQVTIGRSKGKCPIIGNDVYIGPGAKIFGGIKIGNHVRIGANCVVFFNVPDNSTVVLSQPRILIKDPNYRYFIV